MSSTQPSSSSTRIHIIITIIDPSRGKGRAQNEKAQKWERSLLCHYPEPTSPHILFLNPMLFPPADNTNRIATHPLCFQALFYRSLSHIPGPSYPKTFIGIRWATRDRFFESTTNPSASLCHPQCETDATTESECPFFGFAHRNHLLIRSRQGLVFVAASMYT